MQGMMLQSVCLPWLTMRAYLLAVKADRCFMGTLPLKLLTWEGTVQAHQPAMKELWRHRAFRVRGNSHIIQPACKPDQSSFMGASTGAATIHCLKP
jgi:hypothetical protein